MVSIQSTAMPDIAPVNFNAWVFHIHQQVTATYKGPNPTPYVVAMTWAKRQKMINLFKNKLKA